jgi:DNA-binding sugar fermentation-stimulating protein
MGVNIGTLTQASFVIEKKNRFICEVKLISGQLVECYVPSSCRLANFLELEGKHVLIKPTVSNGARTEYTLVAIPFKRSYLLLNSSLANRVIEDSIRGRRFSFLGKRRQIIKEHRVEQYKTDLFISDSSTIIEIKSIISTNQAAVFPTVYSERAINQLKALKIFLQKGYKACYIIVSLNPYVKEVVFDRSAVLFQALADCVSLGLVIKGFACRMDNEIITLRHELTITY